MAPEHPDTGVADQVVEELLAEGTEASPGRFGLDREVARQKLRDFQLEDPWSYPLDLLGTAVCLDATRVDLTVDGATLAVRFDGRPLSATDFTDLYDALFSGGDDETLRARQLLARAIGAAQGLGATQIRVTSGDERGGTAFVARTVGTDDIGPLANACDGTEIRLAHTRQGRGGLSGSEVAARLGEVIRKRGIYTGATVSLNGEPLPDGWEMPDATTHVPFGSTGQGGTLRGVLGAVPKAPHGELRLVVHGVLVETIEVQSLPAGVAGVVTDGAFRTDLGRGAVRQGEALQSAVAAAREVVPALHARLHHRMVEVCHHTPGHSERHVRGPTPSVEPEAIPLDAYYLERRVGGPARALESVKRLLRLAAWGLYLSPLLVLPKLVLWLLHLPAGDYLTVAFVLWTVGFFALVNAFLLLHFLAGPRAQRKTWLDWASEGPTRRRGLRLLGQRTPQVAFEEDRRRLGRGLPADRMLVLEGRIEEPTQEEHGDAAVLRDTWYLHGDAAVRLTALQRFSLDLTDGSGARFDVDLPTAPRLVAPYAPTTLPPSLSPERRSEANGWLEQGRLTGGLAQALSGGRSAALYPGDEIELIVPGGAETTRPTRAHSRPTLVPCLVRVLRRGPRGARAAQESS